MPTYQTDEAFVQRLLDENQRLRDQLQEEREIIEAIRRDRVDAVVVENDRGEEVRFLAGVERIAEQAAGIGCFGVDLRTGRLRASPGFLAIYGLTQEQCEAAPDSWLQAVHPDDRPRVEAFFAEAEQHGEGLARLEFRIRQPDGAISWIEQRASVVRDCQGAATRIIGVHAETTQRKQTEEALRATTARFQAVLEHSLDVTYRRDLLTDRYDYMSPVCQQVLGFSADEMNAMDIAEVMARVHPEDRAAIEAAIAEAARTGSGRLQYRWHHKDGRWRWMADHLTVEKAADGRPVYRSGVVRDITDQKDGEWLLKEKEEKLRVAIEAAELGNWTYNFVDNLWELDQRAQELYGLPSPRAVHSEEHLREILYDEDRPAMWRAVAKARDPAGDGHYEMEYRVRGPGGAERWISAWGQVIFEGEGEQRRAVRMIGTSRDITARKQIQKSLEQAKETAEAANRAKSEFLANMSHEIRTPMTAVLGFAELLKGDDCSPAERREYVQTIAQSGTALLELIDDILDLSKIEAGKANVESIQCSPRQIVEEVVSMMQLRAKEKALSLETRYHYPLPAVICTDPARLRQILVNLLGNAVKFTHRGRVELDVSFREQQAEPKISFAVTDTGIGINPEHVAEIFKPFNQADSSLTRRFGGTGLGLTISRRLAQMLGGDITVASEPGKGSQFTLTVDAGSVSLATLVECPAEKKTEGPSAPQQENRRFAGRVLLVEDNRANQHLVSTLLTKAGLEVDTTDSGEEACRMLFSSSKAKEVYQLILMDIQMPGIDGYEAVGRMRAAGWRGPVVALTAHAMEGDREKCLAAGFDDYLAKPVSRDALLDLVARHAGKDER